MVAPKPERVQAILAQVSKYLDAGTMMGVEADALAQRIRFLRETHFGRCGAKVLRALANHSGASGASMELGVDLKKGLEWLVGFLPGAEPRMARPPALHHEVVFFVYGRGE